MFEIINSVEDFSSNLEEGKFVLVISENIMYVVKDETLINCEDIYENFEEVAYSIMDEGFFSKEESYIFEDAPYYQEGMFGEVYCITFTANKIKSLDENPGELSIVNSSNEVSMYSSFQETEMVNFKLFMLFEDPSSEISKEYPKDFISLGYNVKIENALVEGPIKISISRLGNI